MVVAQTLHEELYEFGWFVRLRRVGPATLHHEVAALALQVTSSGLEREARLLGGRALSGGKGGG